MGGRTDEIHGAAQVAQDFISTVEKDASGAISAEEFAKALNDNRAALCMFSELLPFPIGLEDSLGELKDALDFRRVRELWVGVTKRNEALMALPFKSIPARAGDVHGV